MKNKILKPIILIAVIAIPIIYSFFYLKAYWDPYGNLQDIKIAMVNEDKGYEGENQGQKLIDSMVENGTFTICDVDREKGDKGLVNGEYYAEIKIPETFSKDLNSASEKKKQISTIVYSPNQKSNYLASQIINSAIKTMELKLQAQVAEKVTGTLADKLNEVPDSLTDISDGAGQILDGANTLSDGVSKLDNGAFALRMGTNTAYIGAVEIENQVKKSVNTLANDKSNALDASMLQSIGNQAEQTAQNTILGQAESIGKQAADTASTTIASNAEAIGKQAASQATEKIKSQAEQIGVSAGNKAVETIKLQADSIGTEAANSAIEEVSKSEDLKDIATLAEQKAKLSDEKIAEIKALALSQVGTVTLSEEQKSEIIAKADNGVIAQKTTIDASAEAQVKELLNQTALTAEKIVYLSGGQVDATVAQTIADNYNLAMQSQEEAIYSKAKEQALASAKLIAESTALDTAQQVAQTTANETAQTTAVQVAQLTAIETARTTASEVANQVASMVAGQVADTTAKSVASKVANQVANTTAQTVAGEVAGQVADSTAQSVAGQVASQVADSTAKTVASTVASEVANNTAKTVANEVANQVKQTALTSVATQMTTLAKGLGQLSSGLYEIDAGTGSLIEGVSTLYDGSLDLADGVDTLKSSVDEGKEDTEKELEKLDGIAEFTNDPVEIKEEDYGKVEQYGLSFTPLFLSIGLWVGSLMLYVVLYYDQDKRYKFLCRGSKQTYLQMAMYFGLAILQGIATGILLKAGLHFEVTNNLLYYFTCILTAMTFISIIQCLIMNLGDVGKFLSLIILVLQLAASGGTFPVETVSRGFQKINPFLPMTYSIRLIKESVVMQDKGFAGKNIMILILYLVVTLGITVLAEYFRRKNREEHGAVNKT